MSGKRLRTDFGPLSLDLIEIGDSECESFSDANAEDVLRLNGLLSTTKNTSDESRPNGAPFHRAVMEPGLVGSEIKTRLDELVDAIAMAMHAVNGVASNRTSIALCLAGVGEITIIVDGAQGKLAFELQAVEPSAYEWLESILDLLYQRITARLGDAVRLRILAPPAHGETKVGTAQWHRATE